MRKILVSLVCCVGLISCTNDSEALRTMEDNGFTNVSIEDSGGVFSKFHGCSDKDGAWYEVAATNAAGKNVHLTVCCGGFGSFKGCTIRSR